MHTIGDLWMPFLYDPMSNEELGRFIIYRHERCVRYMQLFVYYNTMLQIYGAGAAPSTSAECACNVQYCH